MELLKREARQLGATEIVLQIDVTENQLRNDGWIRITARPASPAVVVSVETRHGPVSFPCDTFTHWEDNVRAIALGMEALRKVDRYGIAPGGEQYRGWQALPAGTGETGREAAARLLASYLQGTPNVKGTAYTAEDLLTADDETIAWAYRRAVMKVHPDHGGSTDEFEAVQTAFGVLRS
ncbi:MAG: J domain-containing protein [Actinomycetota bacterium]